MNEKIEEIRKRHVKALQTPSDWWTVMGDDANRDRHTLLAEVGQLRAETERLLQAIGLATTAVPNMEIDVNDPIGMMQRVVAEVDRLRSDRRERIATAALQGLLSNSSTNSSSWEIVVAATVYADSLIAKLDEEPQP